MASASAWPKYVVDAQIAQKFPYNLILRVLGDESDIHLLADSLDGADNDGVNRIGIEPVSQAAKDQRQIA